VTVYLIRKLQLPKMGS